MSTTQWPSKVVPAQLSFLAIYNPSLGPTDETFHDQLVFYYSRAAHEARVAARRNARNDAAGGDALRAEENEKLRHIGLAQGMVDFARSFSNGEPVDSIETDKSRIVLHELEKGWWILASIDLTRLPSIPASSSESVKKGSERVDAKPSIEYSTREVSPPALLLQQLLQAHYIFCLHHGPSLNELFVRLTRDKFCNTLDRFWTRFSRSWDVLLHGNPATDIFNGLKLASGGELGFGVGEEEWGSGEREVLEDLTRRTEGLVDMVVMRFGETAPVDGDPSPANDENTPPWIGNGSQPGSSDGIIFSGVGAVERHSLRNVTLWMRQIYTYGEYAYGVRDNPLRERRKRKRGNAEYNGPPNGSIGERQPATSKYTKPQMRLADVKSSVASGEQPKRCEATTTRESPHSGEDNGPIIPPPIVTAAEESLQQATKHVADKDAAQANEETNAVEEQTSTLGIPDQYMKYLTFGLSTLAKPASKPRPPASNGASSTNSGIPQSPNRKLSPSHESQAGPLHGENDDPLLLQQVEPIPDGDTLRAKIATQKRQENRGHFIIGLKGDLLELDELPEQDETDVTDGSDHDAAGGSRIVLRTVQVDVIPRVGEPLSRKASVTGLEGSEGLVSNWHRLRVVIYVHRPFMYCFLFRDRTSSLQWTKFYRTLHRSLVPIHRPLLSSTSAAKITQRIEDSHFSPADGDDASTSGANRLPSKATNSAPIFDLIYDPRLLTLHTSIPNIPEPGTPAAEGILMNLRNDTTAPRAWTRIDALNVHSQILNTLSSVKNRNAEMERTSKTTRGWWVVWMKVPPSASTSNETEGESRVDADASIKAFSGRRGPIDSLADRSSLDEEDVDLHRIAFLVRRASETPPTPKPAQGSSRAVSSMLEVMSLGMAGRSDDERLGGASAGWGPAALDGGIGIDARKYVQGLLSLNR